MRKVVPVTVPPSTEDHDVYEARLKAVYDEAGRAAAHFLGWRHKVILICSAALALTFAAASYIYKEHLGDVPMILTLLLAAAVMLLCMKFDERNGFLLNEASYATAKECEAKLRRRPGLVREIPVGVWTRIDVARGDKRRYDPPPHTYSRMLRRTYQGLATALSLSAAAVALFHLPQPQTDTRQFRVTVLSGPVLCGELLARGADRLVLAVEGTGDVQLIPVTDLRRVEPGSC